MPTPPLNIRLTEEERRTVEAIRARRGLPTAAAAIRHALETERRQIEREDRAAAESDRLERLASSRSNRKAKKNSGLTP